MTERSGRGRRVSPARSARVRAGGGRGTGRADRPPRRLGLAVRAPVGLRRRVLQPDRRARRLRRDPRGTALRLGRVLRGQHAHLAQPLDHQQRLHRVPRGAGLPGRPAHRGGAAPGHGPGRSRAGPGGPGSAGRLRAVPDEPAEAGRRGMDGPQRPAPDALVGRGGRHGPGGRCAGAAPGAGRGRPSRPGAGDIGPGAAAGSGAGRGSVAGHRGVLGGGRPGARPEPGRRGQPAQLRGAGRADQQHRRHGRRGHHVAAGALQGRPELRLPLRMDPGPVLRRPGRGRRRPAPPAGRRRLLRGRAHPGRRP